MMATLPLETEVSTLEHIDLAHRKAKRVLEKLRERNIAASPPRSGPTFTISQAAALIDRSVSSIRTAEAEGRLPHQERNELGRRQGYTLREIDHMREVFDTRPWRAETDPPAIIACQNFKGGVGKSTISVHMAQYLAIHGYRVLLIDADAQASTTMQFGYIPDSDLGPLDSIYALLQVKPERGIRSLIRPTHFHNLDLIPANLKLYNAEYEVAARIPKFGFKILGILSREIARIADDYDVIIMDPPPALGMVSLSVLYAANALIIPMPPSTVDFASTTSFLGMLSETMDELSEHGMIPDYGFIHMLISKSDSTVDAQRQVVEMANGVFGKTVMASELKTSAEFNNASVQMQSVYDLPGSTTNHAVRRRCLRQIDAVGQETEGLIKGLWPSKRAEL